MTLMASWILPCAGFAGNADVGAIPPADLVPKLEFAFEERVTL
jgi:hypothetical protein